MSWQLQFAESLGNKFIIINSLITKQIINNALISDLANKFEFDQLIILENFYQAKLYITIFNRDTSLAEACGNAFRCLGLFIHHHFNCNEFTIINHQGDSFPCKYLGPNNIAVSFPKLEFNLNDNINFTEYQLNNGMEINIGNPHLLFKVPELELKFLARYGEEIISNPLFPNKINLSLIKIINPSEIDIITYERGAGITQACGSGALAASIFCRLKHNGTEKIIVKMLGGELITYWQGGPNLPEIIGPATINEQLELYYS